eukprot:2420685-Prymnesium_polylepis.1
MEANGKWPCGQTTLAGRASWVSQLRLDACCQWQSQDNGNWASPHHCGQTDATCIVLFNDLTLNVVARSNVSAPCGAPPPLSPPPRWPPPPSPSPPLPLSPRSPPSSPSWPSRPVPGSEGSDGGMDGGAITGLVLGVVAASGLLGFGMWWYAKPGAKRALSTAEIDTLQLEVATRVGAPPPPQSKFA